MHEVISLPIVFRDNMVFLGRLFQHPLHFCIFHRVIRLLFLVFHLCLLSELLERNSATRIYVLNDLLLQLHNVLPEVVHGAAQIRILSLQQLHLVLQL